MIGRGASVPRPPPLSAVFISYIVLFFDPRQYGHASGNAPPWPPATPSGAVMREHVQPVPLCHWVTDPRRLARLRARVSTPFSQTVRMVFERQLALPAALRQSCSEEFEHRPTGLPLPNKCDCRKSRTANNPFDPKIAPRRLLFFLSAERVLPAGIWLHGAAWNAVRAEGGTESVPPPPNEMCSTSSLTGWCHCHHDTTSALCRAESRSVGALDRTPLPVACLASEKSTI